MSQVFISHGHNQEVKLLLKEFIRDRLNLIPVVLSEQPDKGMTIVEKLEHYGGTCSTALILLTADDQTENGGIRARQNVIHELGFFHGLLGRKRVLLVKQSGIELFSNISGLIYKEYPETNISFIFEDIRLFIENQGAEIPSISSKKKDLQKANRNIKFFQLGASVGNKLSLLPLPELSSGKEDFLKFIRILDQAGLSEMASVLELKSVGEEISDGLKNNKNAKDLIFIFFNKIDEVALELRDTSTKAEYRWFLLGHNLLQIATLAAASSSFELDDETINDAVDKLEALYVDMRLSKSISSQIKKLIDVVHKGGAQDEIVNEANRVASNIEILL